jgi:hypothetical protein
MPTFCFACRSSSAVSSRPLLIAAVTVILLASLLSAEARAQDGEQPATPPFAGEGEPRTPHSAQEYYGLNFVAPFQPWLRYGLETGAGTVRWQFNWRDHETSPGTWVWQAADGPIRSWNNAGYRIHAILHNPPDFAKVRSDGLMPHNVRLPWTDPANGFAQYCYKFAQRYRGQIDSYEIWNEPDLNIYWDGTAEEYFYLMKSCYLAIKAADPDVTVAMAGMVILAERNFLPEVLRLAASDPEGSANNYFFDVANVHMYADPSLVYSLTQHTRRLLTTYGQGDKPIWVTETNVALAGYGDFPNRDWGHVTPEEQAWYVIQATANAYAAGADRLMFFRLADDDMDEYFGLMTNNYTLRPSYRTLQIVTSLVHDIVAVRREIRQGVIITYLVRSDGARITILYSETGTGLNLTLEAHQTAAVVITATGGSSTVRANNGVYTVTLPTARGRDFSRAEQYAVGGPPLIVVEQDTQPPVSWIEVHPIPETNGQVTIKVYSDDGEFGTGTESYEIQVSINDGEWQPLAAGVTETEMLYDISDGGNFAFRVRAVDRAGNMGEFSQPVSTSLTRTGTLLIEVRDLRGQPVPYARVTLSDGTLYDADEHGIVTIVAEPGLIRVSSIDGSGQGRLTPSQPYEIELLEQSLASWTLMPLQDLIENGQFEFGLQGWTWSAPADVLTSRFDAQRGAVLRLQGVMRPWGPPAAATTVDVPPGWTGGLVSFYYRLDELQRPIGSSQTPPYLRLRAFTETEQDILWYATEPSADFQRVWVDMSAYEGQQVALVFELIGPKLGSEGAAEIDDVIFGNVPVLP